MKIACLEDDPVQASVLKEWIEDAGYECETFDCVEKLKSSFSPQQHGVAILDWELPDGTGLDALEHIRQHHSSNTPVLFITHRDSESDIVNALEAGADDFMSKPVSRPVTLARLKALARRNATMETHSNTLEKGNIQLSKNPQTAILDDTPIVLTDKEFQLTWILLSSIGQLHSRQSLLEHVWGIGNELVTRTVDTHISKIRRKLKLTPEHGWHLKAVYHQGYRLEQLENLTEST